MFDTILPSGGRMRFQVLRVAVPREGRMLPLLRLAYDRDACRRTGARTDLSGTRF